ncbi:MAG: glycosyltransferase [Sphingomonadales bacterium]|nr:glycosyltransferase [Sphingomonadales bacterium]
MALLPPHMREGTERLTDLLRHDAPEVVQIWQDGTIFAAGLAALLAGVPRILLNVRTMPPTARIDRMRPEQATLYRGLVQAPGVTLTANSRIAARGYEQWLGLPRGAVAVILNGVEPLPTGSGPLDADRWRGFDERTGGGFVFGGVMRFDDNKRPIEWLAIAAALSARLPDARFVLVGDGPLRAAAEAFAHRKRIAERTLFVGRSAAVGFWLDRFDALGLTSRHEGTPNVLIEAQLAGVPVVTTPAGGAVDAVAPIDANLILADAERPERDAAVGHLIGLSARNGERIDADAGTIRSWAGRFSTGEMIERTLELFGAPR